MGENEDVQLEYFSGEVVSASEAKHLLARYDPGSVLRSFAEAIIDHAHENGLARLTDSEAEFAALEVYQSSVANDGFASLYYNEANFIPAMLAGTKRMGAKVAHDLILRGLSELGLSTSASEHEIHAAAQQILHALDLGDGSLEAKPGLRDQILQKFRTALGALGLADDPEKKAKRMLHAFDVLEQEFNEQVAHLDNEQIGLLGASFADFKNFP
jgi:hypothetical protein